MPAVQIDLHGAEVLHLPSQATPITVGPSSVIGLVGAAPNAQAAVAARLVIGEGDAAISITADSAGVAGNDISVEVVATGTDEDLAATYDAATKRVTIQLATDSSGDLEAASNTGALVFAAVNNSVGVAAVVTGALAAGSDGSGSLAAAVAPTPLAGGADQPFPLNTPVLLATSRSAAALGASGSLVDAIHDVWRTSGRYGATIVAVRVDSDGAADIIGTRAAGSGIYALLRARSRTGQQPRLIAAPGLQDDTVTAALETVAEELHGTAVVTLSQATAALAITGKPATGHVYACWPKLAIYDGAAGRVRSRPADGLVLGLIARNDREESYAASPSNRRLYDVLRTAVDVDWQVDSRASTANLLSRAYITTAIRREDGLYLWGNRLLDGELISHRRTRFLVGDALLSYVVDYIDRNVDVPFVEFILQKMNSFLRTQTLARKLSGGRAWFDPQYNTADTLSSDRVTFSFELGLYNVAEQITFRSSVSTDYNERIIEQLTRG